MLDRDGLTEDISELAHKVCILMNNFDITLKPEITLGNGSDLGRPATPNNAPALAGFLRTQKHIEMILRKASAWGIEGFLTMLLRSNSGGGVVG